MFDNSFIGDLFNCFLLSATRGFKVFENNKKNESQPPTKV